jgi:hypothetical protein
MNELNLVIENTEVTKPAAVELIELTLEQLDKVGGGVAYVLM